MDSSLEPLNLLSHPMSVSFLTYWNTIKYLRPVQVAARMRPLLRPFRAAPLIVGRENLRFRMQEGTTFAADVKPLTLPHLWRFLNSDSECDGRWNYPQKSRLWNYQLHYHDFLRSGMAGEDERVEAVRILESWMDKNPPFAGTGWEPFPTSMRIVNWVQFLTRAVPGGWVSQKQLAQLLQSLYVQTSWLDRNLEYHLLANHLLKNVKALVMAGVFLQCERSTQWLERGIRVLRKQLNDQILPDGGHIERSPMYHAETCVDLIDLSVTLKACDSMGFLPVQESELLPSIIMAAGSMLDWLSWMSHPDGGVAFFNDTVLGEAPDLEALLHRACVSGMQLETARAPSDVLSESFAAHELKDSGFYAAAGKGAYLVFDDGPVGPDYQPGHAHCDTLSYELSLFGKRAIVNSGVYEYAPGTRRMEDRSTAAHNTVRIDGTEQSEVWASHRVARRAYPKDASLQTGGEKVIMSGSHDGYRRLKGKPYHTRQIHVGPGQEILVCDAIRGEGQHTVESFIHFHPDWKPTITGRTVVLRHADHQYRITVGSDCDIKILDTEYAPRFGLTIPNKTLLLKRSGVLPFDVNYRMVWA